MLRTLFSTLLFLSLAACSNGGGNDNANVTEPANTAPQISAIGDQSLEANTAMEAIGFSISDDTTAASQLSVSVTSDNEALLASESLMIEGSGTERTLLITPRPDQLGMVLLTIQVQDEQALAAEESFLLTVVPAITSFDSLLRTVFAADPNSEPVPINALEFSQDAADFSDLLL